MTHSRNKGRTAEREVELILQAAGLSTDRNIGGRRQVSGDIAARLPGSGGEHDCGFDCLDGGYRGYQAVCWTCGWRGTEHLRGDEEMGTPESRVHKMNAREEAHEHREATRVTPYSLAIEVRRRERLLIPAWCADHEASTPEGSIPVLAWRANRMPWRASLLLDDLLTLIGTDAPNREDT